MALGLGFRVDFKDLGIRGEWDAGLKACGLKFGLKGCGFRVYRCLSADESQHQNILIKRIATHSSITEALRSQPRRDVARTSGGRGRGPVCQNFCAAVLNSNDIRLYRGLINEYISL